MPGHVWPCRAKPVSHVVASGWQGETNGSPSWTSSLPPAFVWLAGHELRHTMAYRAMLCHAVDWGWSLIHGRPHGSMAHANHVMPCLAWHTLSCQAMRAMACMPGHALPCHARPCHTVPWHTMAYHVYHFAKFVPPLSARAPMSGNLNPEARPPWIGQVGPRDAPFGVRLPLWPSPGTCPGQPSSSD